MRGFIGREVVTEAAAREAAARERRRRERQEERGRWRWRWRRWRLGYYHLHERVELREGLLAAVGAEQLEVAGQVGADDVRRHLLLDVLLCPGRMGGDGSA